MAVNNPSGLTINNPQTGIQYTKVTDSSADWASVPNNIYFYDYTDKIVYYKDNTGNVLSIFSATGGSATWGSITGTLSTQTDLQSALDTKIDGTGTSNYVSKFSDSNTLTNSLIQDNGSGIGIGNAPNSNTLTYCIQGTKNFTGVFQNTYTGANVYGLIGHSLPPTTNFSTIGIKAEAEGSVISNTGLQALAINSTAGTNIGGFFQAQLGASNYAIQLNDGTEAINKYLKSTDSTGKANWSYIQGTEIYGGNNLDVLTSNGTNAVWDKIDLHKLSINNIYRGIYFNNNSTSIQIDGGVTTGGNYSSLAQSVASTNFATKNIRMRLYASVVQTGRLTTIRGSALLWYITGGFKFTCDFNISDTVYGSTCQQFYGLAGTTSDLAYGGTSSIALSTLTNLIGVGSEASDTNLQFIYNDSTGTASKIDLGSNFPANRDSVNISTTIYSVYIYNLPSSSVVFYKVVNNETGNSVTGSVNTDLPASTQGLNFHASRAMGTPTTNTGQFDLYKLGVYSML